MSLRAVVLGHGNGVASAAAALMLLSGCNLDSSPTQALDRIESKIRGGSSASETFEFRPSAVSPEEALPLSERLKLRAAPRDIVNVLRAVHYYKRGHKDAALVALELVTVPLAKEIVRSSRERRELVRQELEVDFEEGHELRAELESLGSLSDCQVAVRTGQFSPLTGPQFCALWDSGILELLPSPSRFLTGAARVTVRQSLARLPRDRLRNVPRAAAVLAKHEGRRTSLRQQIAARAEEEDRLARQLMDMHWKLIVDGSWLR